MAKVIKTGDFTEVETDFTHAPVGLYHGKVVEITQKTSGNDEEMVEVRWQLTKDADGKKLKKSYANLWYYAPIDADSSWARRMKELLLAFGLKVKGDNVAKVEGKEALLRLKDGTDQDGEYRPNISKILKAGSVEPTDDEEEEEPEDSEEEDEEEVEYEDLSLAELKEELEGRELSTKGKKAALIARLEEDDESEDEDDDDEEEPEDAEDEVDLDSMDRKGLKAFIKEEELDVKVTAKMDEDDIRQAIEEQMEEAEDDEEEEEEEEDEEEEPEDEADEDEEDNYDDMAVAELKQELEDRELKTDGTKKVLIARLRKDDEVPV